MASSSIEKIVMWLEICSFASAGLFTCSLIIELGLVFSIGAAHQYENMIVLIPILIYMVK